MALARRLRAERRASIAASAAPPPARTAVDYGLTEAAANAIASAFPNRIESRTAKRVFALLDLGAGSSAQDVAPVAQAVFIEVHKLLRKATSQGADNRFQFKTFNLSILAKARYPDGPAERQSWGWVHIDLGAYSREAFTDAQPLQQGIYAALMASVQHYGEIVETSAVRCRIADISWNVRGACKSSKATVRDTESGILLTQYKSKAGNCGPTCVSRALKSMSSQLDPAAYRNLNSVLKLRNCASAVFPELESDRSMSWSPMMLAHALKRLQVNLVVYSVGDLLGRPIYGSESTIGLGVIRLAWCAPGGPYADECGHYLLITEMTSTCIQCGVSVERFNIRTNKSIIHRCSKVCGDCGETVKGSTTKHHCAGNRASEKALLEDELRLPPSAAEQRRIEEVETLMSGVVDDAPTILAWHADMANGSSTCLLGDAGSGKTYAIKEHIKQHIRSHPTNSIAVIGAEAVGVSPYCELAGVFVSTIHSFLSLPVGKDAIAHANRLVAYRHSPPETVTTTLNRLRSLEVLVVDEVGSCSLDLFSSLDAVLQIVRDDPRDFGGLRMILSGDFRQRGSIQLNQNSVTPIFMADLWSRMNLSYHVLRQDRRISGTGVDDVTFSRCLKKMSRGVLSTDELAFMNAKCLVSADSPVHSDREVVHLMDTNKQVYDKGHEQVRKFFFGDSLHSYPIKDGDGKPLKPGEMRIYDDELLLGLGCPVMFTTNQFIKRPGSPRNGTRATVHAFHSDTLEVLLVSGHIITVGRYSIGKARGTQFPLRNAYASTIAKSQGATLAKVCLWPPTAAFRRQASDALMYVGCSRVRALSQLSFGTTLYNSAISYCALSVLFMDLIQSMPYDTVLQRLFLYKSQGVNAAQLLHPTNMHQVSRTVVVQDKSVYTKGALPMYTRAKIERMAVQKQNKEKVEGRQNYYTENFHNVVYLDFETAPVGPQQMLQPYSVFAKHWQDYKVAHTLDYGVMSEGGVQGDCLGKFTGWLMDDIVMPRCREWIASDYKECKAATRIVAWNGSRFDFLFLFRYFLSEGRWEGLHYETTVKGGQIMSLQCNFTHEGATKAAFVLWDPCLIVSSSLDKAHGSFCKDAHRTLSKDCFPHLYVNRIGAEAAFRIAGEVELNIMEDFPEAHTAVVETRIKAGELQRGSAPGTVLFNPVLEARQYVHKDVIMLENVVEELSILCWDEVLPGMNVPIFRFITASSYSFYCTIVLLPDTIKDDNGVYRSNLYRLSYRQDRIVREATYGGKTVHRAMHYRAPGGADILSKHDMAFLSQPDYLDLQDYVKARGAFYLDIVGMYHYLCKVMGFPYGPSTELLIQCFIDLFFQQFMACSDAEAEAFPLFFMRLDVSPNKYDVEPCLPSRDHVGGRLLWQNLDKKGQVYSSVHLRMAIRRGYVLSNPTWVLLWGKQDAVTGQWVGTKKRLFESSSEKWLDMRLKGDAYKDLGKGLANTWYGGAMKRDYLSDTQIYESKTGEGPSPRLEEYTERLRDPRWQSTYEQAFMRDEETAVLMTKWEAQIDEDEFTCSRCSYIGAFVLAYAHELIDNSVEALLGEKRRDGTVTTQILNGDTDSLMVDIRHCKPGTLSFSSTELGCFNDDLKGLWSAPKEVEYTAEGLPRFCKVLEMVSTGKKMYSMRVISPDGRVHTVNPKSKGIAKGRQCYIQTGVEKRKMHDEQQYSAKRACTGSPEERKVEKDKLAEYYDAQSYTSGLTFDDLKATITKPEDEGIVVSSKSMKKYGAHVPPKLLRAGVMPFSIQDVTMTRHILRSGAQFPPERVAIETPDDPDTTWSVPLGWIKKPQS